KTDDKKNDDKKESDSGSTSKPSTPSTNTTLGLPVSHATVTATAWYYPASFGGGWHPGIDLANKTGTKLKSPGKGVVLVRSYDSGGYGNYVVTAHQVGNDTYTFIYGHMSKQAATGSTISKGQTVGYMGSTGNSTGPHVHVEIFKHKNKSLSKVVSTYKKNYDIYFGLGYNSKGNCAKVCRLQPQVYYGLKYYQTF
ncbi:M23 family metallopeptidase, partial [Erysipelotrichaceae bacterium OttesenSCG-928-M19]|nr:M23 family metallopeptidase [Erysipelotrichaceae bacterium OttesenSCG-928-M19]